VAFMKALDLLHRVMHVVKYRRIVMTLKWPLKWVHNTSLFCLLLPWWPPRRYGASSRPMAASSGFRCSHGHAALGDAEACATTEKMIFIPTLKPQAQGRPTLRRFSHLFVSDRFWCTPGAFSKTTIFFKLQAGVSLVSSAPSPRPHHAPAPPPPHPNLTV